MSARARSPLPSSLAAENGAAARSGFPKALAATGIALLCGWLVYAAPPARAKAAALLRPALGALLPTEPEIKFGETRARRMEVNGQTVLFVEGSLTNVGKSRRKAPTLVLTLTGDDDRPLYAWTSKTAAAQLEAGREATFQTRLLAPPEKFKAIVVSLKEG